MLSLLKYIFSLWTSSPSTPIVDKRKTVVSRKGNSYSRSKRNQRLGVMKVRWRNTSFFSRIGKAAQYNEHLYCLEITLEHLGEVSLKYGSFQGQLFGTTHAWYIWILCKYLPMSNISVIFVGYAEVLAV